MINITLAEIYRHCKRQGKCLIWQGKRAGKLSHQYGQVKRWIDGKEKYFKVHRLVYELKYGPTDLFVCHKCDNTLCCDWRCLFAGTATDNMRDMSRKGRGKPNGRDYYVCKC